jgi:peptidoglycan/LPS O-acetylase OafA/YrhL
MLGARRAAETLSPETPPMYVQTLDQLFSLAMLLTCCGLAVWRGRWVERIAAAAMAAAWFVSPLVQDDQQTLGAQSGVLVVDILLLLVLLYLALTSDRWWTMAAVAFQGVSALVHLAAAIDKQIIPRAYYVAGSLLSYLVMGALLVGAWNAGRRERPRPDGVA